MTYDEALKILSETTIDYIPSAASWVEGLHDLWTGNRDVFLAVVTEWQKRWKDHSYREVCATCRSGGPEHQDEVWCTFGGVRNNKGFWCPLWEEKR